MDGIRKIGLCAFSGCTALTEIVIPETVSSLGEWVFFNCTNLKTVYSETRAKPASWNKDWAYGIEETAEILFKESWSYIDGIPTKK